MGRAKLKKIIIDADTTLIKCSKIEITDSGKPFTTEVKVNGKALKKLFIIQKFKYEVNVNGKNAGKHMLTIECYPKNK